ncbi:MAG: NAD-dependent epimerase/dehydratase [Jatrophihabitantaceae bacterium]|nr:NAD-dependent epimerase/dehydratase [Jatrophihabitantaceae bacterium]
MRVLLTGATGALGRSTAEALLREGHDLTVLQRRPSGLDCREVLGDVADGGATAAAAAGQDVVIHTAAKVDVVGPWKEFARANIDGTRSIIDACLAGDVPALVHISTPSVAHAGHALMGVGAEPADVRGTRGHYARSKAIAERIALRADGDRLAVLVLRPHLVWGPGDPQLVGRIVERARRGRLAVIGAGAALIDTTYIDNAVDALLAAARVCGPVHGEALVVSNGEPRPIAEILERLCRAAGVGPPRRHVPYSAAYAAGTVIDAAWWIAKRRTTPPITRFLAQQLATAHWFDQRRTRELLSWTPRTSLDQGFEQLRASYTTSD